MLASRILGVAAVCQRDPHNWFVHALAVVPEWQRKGIGSALFLAVEQELMQQGAKALSIYVQTSDYAQPYFDGIQQFYESFKFRPCLSLQQANPLKTSILMVKEFPVSSESRQFTDRRLVIASHNPGKAREIGELLAPFAVEAISAAALHLPEPEETGTTFIANAELKARAAAAASGLPALADDSGLVVPALDGAPGTFSARWAGPGKDFASAMRRVEDELRARGATDRRAHFIAALSLCWPDGHCESFEGRVDGMLTWPARGNKGFGYDPIFVPDGRRRTFGEMEPAAKHAISHRADAFRRLTAACFAR